MEQLTRGRFHQGGVTYENVASPNGIVKEVSKADGYATVDGEKIYPKVMQAESKTILSSTGELPAGIDGAIYFVQSSSGVVAYQYKTDEWIAIKHMVDGDLISVEGILYEYTNGAFNETATATSVGAVPSNSETPTYTSYIRNNNSKIELYQQVNNGVSGFTQPDNRLEVDQNGVITTSEEGHSNFANYSKSTLTSFDGKVRYKKSQFNYVEGEFRHEEEVLKDGEIATTDEVAVKEDKATIEAYTIASNSWTSLASSEPFKFSTTVTATYTIGNDTEVGIINDQAILFANYGFIVGSVSGQNVTIYAIAQPDTSVSLTVGYRG